MRHDLLDLRRVSCYEFAAEQELVQLKRQSGMQSPYIPRRSEPTDCSGGPARNDEGDDFLLDDKVLDQRRVIGNELLNIFKAGDINALQRNVFGIFDGRFAQNTGEFLFLCDNRLKIRRAGLNFRLRLHVMSIQFLAQPIDSSAD